VTTGLRRGRPRDEAIDAAILAAMVDELIERGFVSASMEGVAGRAGVAKTTLYRRWPQIADLALAAMQSFEVVVDDPPHGSPRDQLAWLLDGMRRKWNDPRYAALMRRVAADGTVSPEVYRHTRDRLIGPHVRRMNAVLHRAVDEGVIRPDVDVAWVRQMLVAPIMAAALTHKDRLGAAQVNATLDTVLRGLAP
jgi:AcrR family transcriptional regulator